MATPTTAITLNCYVSGDPHSRIIPISVAPSQTISDLICAFLHGYRQQGYGELREPSLFRTDLLESELLAFVPPSLDECLRNHYKLGRYWGATGQIDDSRVHVFVVVQGKYHAQDNLPKMLRGSSTTTSNSDTERISKNEKAQSKVIRALQNQSSSRLASPSEYRRLQKTSNAILNGRPDNCIGLPIGLYHPVFDAFLARLNSSSDAISPKKLVDTIRLLKASQMLYDSETGAGGRTEGIKSILGDLIGNYIGVREEMGVKADGNISTPNGAHCMVMEVKNEIGLGGCDPSVQGSLSYSKYWGQARMRPILHACCCPSFILAVAGPWMCVLGAVMLERPVVQPLTPFLWVANSSSPRTQSDDYKLAQVFSSLSSSIADLFHFYANLPLISKNDERFDPYMRHFPHSENCTKFKYDYLLKDGNAVFRATTKPSTDELNNDGHSSRSIVVKFSESYHVAAHRLLVEARLAPKLLFVSSEGPNGFKIAQRSMIVMEHIQGETLAEMTAVPQQVKDDVARALKILHKNNIVFGDLRHPNVIAVQDHQGTVTGGMLVDFDWCGEHGQARYPTDINPNIDWPEGVGPGTTMMMEHDWTMFENLS